MTSKSERQQIALYKICKQTANRTGEAAYIVAPINGKRRVMQSGMFGPLARRKAISGGLSIYWAVWPDWRYKEKR